MTASSWRRASRADLDSLRAWLEPREERCAGFTGRLLRGGELFLPNPLRGGVWIAGDEGGGKGIAGAVLCHPSRLAFPLLPPDAGRAAGELADILLARAWVPASSIGPAGDVAAIGPAWGLEVKVRVEYELMALPPRLPPGAEDGAPPAAMPVGLSIRRAGPSDAELLYPLQEAYEREEVLTSLHRFDAAACRAGLERSLRDQIVLVAEAEGSAVAKAGTNARGFGVDQIGGVYTLPSRRGSGIGRALVAALVAGSAVSGRGCVLFVKKENAPAIALYRGLGFEERCDYRADYYGA